MTTEEFNALKAWLQAHPDQTDDTAVATDLQPTTSLQPVPYTTFQPVAMTLEGYSQIIIQADNLSAVSVPPGATVTLPGSDTPIPLTLAMIQDALVRASNLLRNYSAPTVDFANPAYAKAFAVLQAAGLLSAQDVETMTSLAEQQTYPLGIPFALSAADVTAADVTAARAALAIQTTNQAARQSLQAGFQAAMGYIDQEDRDGVAVAWADVVSRVQAAGA